MKVLFLPLNFGSVVQHGWYDAFREHGVHLEIFDYMTDFQNSRRKNGLVRDQFLKKVIEFQPDLLFMQIQHTNVIDHKAVLNAKKYAPHCKIVNWTGDVRNNVPVTYKKIAEVSDLNLISSTGQLEMFKREINRPIEYLQIGYNPKMYYPEEGERQDFTWDVTFSAHYNQKEDYPGRAEREMAANLLRREFGNKFCLYGGFWPNSFKSKGSIDQTALTSVYHQSFCTISISHFNDLNHYFSDRLLLCMAAGRPVISYRFPKWESYFTNMSDLIIVDTIAEIPEKIKWLMQNKPLANFIGKSGAAKVRAEHTYFSRVSELFDIVGMRP